MSFKYNWDEININWEDLDMNWEDVGIYTYDVLPFIPIPGVTIVWEYLNNIPTEKKIELNPLIIKPLTSQVATTPIISPIVTEEKNLLTTKLDIWALTKKYQALRSVERGDKSVSGISGLESIYLEEKLIDKKIATINEMIDDLDKIILTLPISIKPYTANFGITAKNPKPIIKIADNLEDNVNPAVIDNLIDKASLTSEDMMLPKSAHDLRIKTSTVNYSSLKKVLSASSLFTVTKDTFPKYEMLKPTNVQWLLFLYKDFVPTGAKTFGFPLQPPIPI